MGTPNTDLLIGWMRGREVRFGSFSIRFRDREDEAKALFNDAFRFQHVGIIYGPLGAGKSTFLRLFIEGLNELHHGFIGIYMNYDDHAFEVMARDLGFLGRRRLKDTISKALRRLVEAAGQGASGAVINILIDLAYTLYKVIKGLGVEKAVIIHDDLDRFLTSKGLSCNSVMGIIGLYANLYEGGPVNREAPWGSKYTVTYVALSDYMAVEATDKYIGKGGLNALLMWNLPRRAFNELVSESVNKADMKAIEVDYELLWQLLGGNPRALAELVVGHGLNPEPWIRRSIDKVVKAVNEEKDRLGLSSVNEVLGIIAKHANSPSPDSLILDTPLKLEPFMRNNIVLWISPSALSQLPNEPWIGKHLAYQLPIYYWVVEAMVHKGTVNVEPKDVVEAIRRH